MTERTAKNTLTVSLLAGLAGIGLGLLFAPRSGKETRERIKTRAGKVRSDTDEKIDHGKQKVQELKNRLQEAVSSSGKKAGKKLEEYSENMQPNEAGKLPVLTAWKEEV